MHLCTEYAIECNKCIKCMLCIVLRGTILYMYCLYFFGLIILINYAIFEISLCQVLVIDVKCMSNNGKIHKKENISNIYM